MAAGSQRWLADGHGSGFEERVTTAIDQEYGIVPDVIDARKAMRLPEFAGRRGRASRRRRVTALAQSGSI
jgi:hypothetical protein